MNQHSKSVWAVHDRLRELEEPLDAPVIEDDYVPFDWPAPPAYPTEVWGIGTAQPHRVRQWRRILWGEE